MTTPGRRRSMLASTVALVVGASVAIAACTPDPNSVAGQAASGDRKGYVSGDGTVTQIEPARRGEPIALKGTLLDGTPWSVEEARGKVVVLNVWGQWCPPCVAEMPILQKSWASLSAAGKPVVFVGLDVRDSPETAASFLTKAQVTFPSLRYDGGVPLLALKGKAPTIPATVVLDAQGRIAARILGPVTEATLGGVVDDALKELR
jgi:thiol-disulfide isomerase/thioredoxin